LNDDPSRSIEILDGVIEIMLSGPPNTVTPSWGGSLDSHVTAKDFLGRLKSDLLLKINQIREFKDSQNVKASDAVVFFSGIDDWSMEWYQLWQSMRYQKDNSLWPWTCIKVIKQEADALVGMPFQLIFGCGNPVEYNPFPRKAEDAS
jgi:hypothetical protein